MKKPAKQSGLPALEAASKALFKEVAGLLENSKAKVAQTVNHEITMLYWNIGRSINTPLLKFKRAQKGEELIGKLAEQLTSAFGKGWTKRQLWRYARFAAVFDKDQLVTAMRSLMSWTHLRTLSAIEDDT